MTPTKIHEIDVLIDVFTPCLKDILTGEVVNTEVIRIRRAEGHVHRLDVYGPTE
jgi:hypothetical protein